MITDLGEGKSSSRLQSMGICLGRKVEVVKSGDPLILKVYGTRIGLSARMAAQIQIEPCERAGRCWERRHTDG
jgi:Fe2+ transport system protein FeoA